MKTGKILAFIIAILTLIAFVLWKLFAPKGAFLEAVKRLTLSRVAWRALPDVDDIAKAYQEEAAKVTVDLEKAKKDELRKRFQDAFGGKS